MQKDIGKTISPDGSERSFSTLYWQGKPAVKIVPSPGRQGLEEARSFYHIGTHLFERGIPTPEIYFFDNETGVLVVEDLGRTMLFDEVSASLIKAADPAPVKGLYLKVLKILLEMQVKGGQGFNKSWCWQTGIYNDKLAYEKETSYFLDSFVRDYSGKDVTDEVIKELCWLARQVANFTCERFFLHRDFQSRNIMVCKGEDQRFGIIDFQAGRYGPLCYDVASLLNDPYVNLDFSTRLELFDSYVQMVEDAGMSKEAKELLQQWPVLSALRLMQALGAFGFLTHKKGKHFFSAYVTPALEGLIWILKANLCKEMPHTIELCISLKG